MVLLADVLCERLLEEGVPTKSLDLVRAPFEHMASGLAASDVRQR